MLQTLSIRPLGSLKQYITIDYEMTHKKAFLILYKKLELTNHFFKYFGTLNTVI